MPFEVVYIDDEPDLLELFVDMFSDESVKIITFSDPEAALLHFERNPPDLVFIDYRLRGTTGDKVAELIEQRFKGRFPKALITGELDLKVPEHAFDEVFFKPYTSQAIRAFIESHRQSKVDRLVEPN